MTDDAKQTLVNAIAKLKTVTPQKRNRPIFEHLMAETYKDGLNGETLEATGLVKHVVNDGYGRGLVHNIEGIDIPTGSEMLVVTVPAGYAPAIHDHSDDTIGAHLLATSGSFYNVDYSFFPDENGVQVLSHRSIQLFEEGTVAFVPGRRGGIHRVVNLGDEESTSLNFYWTTKPGGAVNTAAYVYNFGLDGGTRFTSGGPAFFFVTGEDHTSGLRADALVQLEDFTFQHHQLKTAKDAEVIPAERVPLLERIQEFVKSPEFAELYASAAGIASEFLTTRSEEQAAVTKGYFKALFEMTVKMARDSGVRSLQVPDFDGQERRK